MQEARYTREGLEVRTRNRFAVPSLSADQYTHAERSGV